MGVACCEEKERLKRARARSFSVGVCSRGARGGGVGKLSRASGGVLDLGGP